MSSSDVAHFKEVLGHFATGVVVITAQGVSGPAGFTCQTFGSLSLDPLLISFAAKTASTSWPKVRSAGVLGVNILASDQEPIARRFATSGQDKFVDLMWVGGPQGSPLINGAVAHLEGRVVSFSTHGDHDLVVVEVAYVASHAGRPLIYYRGGFSALA